MEEIVSHVKWIAPSPRMESHTLVSTSMVVRNIGVPGVPREDDGVTISVKNTRNGLSVSLSAKKSKWRKLLKISWHRLQQLLPMPIRNLPIRASPRLVPCVVVMHPT